MRNHHVLAVLLMTGWAVGCSETPTGTTLSITTGLIVSDPGPAPAPTAPGLKSLSSNAPGDVVFVSLTPGSVPGGASAALTNLASGATVITTLENGGFDPAPVPASAGDVVEVVVRDPSGVALSTTHTTVALRLAPSIVRTDPPHRKRDVALNSILGIVFSERVDPATISPSTVQLLKNGAPVAGTVTLLQGTATEAVFTPSVPLDPNTDYQLVLSNGVKDLQGDPLVAPPTVDFTTGTTTVGAVAWVSLGLNPDTPATVVSLGSQFQLKATARDAQGMEVVGRPVTWGSSGPSVVSVSATGLVTALASGGATITATVDGQSGTALFAVTTIPVGTVTVTPESVRVALGGAVPLRAAVWDPNGQGLNQRLVTWSTSNPMIATVAPSQSSQSNPVMVTGVAAGIAKISATVDGKSDTAIVTVSAVPSGGRIAFANSGDIWVMNADGSGVVPIYTWGGLAGPAWSPNGMRIAVGGYEIDVMNADGSQVTCLSCGRSTKGVSDHLGDPAWSPDGTKIAATNQYDTCAQKNARTGLCIRWVHHYDIVVMNTAGQIVPGGVAGGSEPAWSPDGRIAFARDIGGISVMNADGSGVTSLSPSGFSPAWSPDGSRIAFWDNRTGVAGLYAMNADGSGVRILTADSTAGSPAWSPDGRRIAFASGRDGTGYFKIYVMNADGSGVVRLTDNPAVDPAWTR